MSSKEYLFLYQQIFMWYIDPIQKNELVIDAVIRVSEVIGEASRRFLETLIILLYSWQRACAIF